MHRSIGAQTTLRTGPVAEPIPKVACVAYAYAYLYLYLFYLPMKTHRALAHVPVASGVALGPWVAQSRIPSLMGSLTRLQLVF